MATSFIVADWEVVVFLSLFSRMKTLTGLWTRPLSWPGVWRGPQTGWLRDCQRTWPRHSTAGNSTACSHQGAGNTTHYKMQHAEEFSLTVESIFDLVLKENYWEDSLLKEFFNVVVHHLFIKSLNLHWLNFGFNNTNKVLWFFSISFFVSIYYILTTCILIQFLF